MFESATADIRKKVTMVIVIVVVLVVLWQIYGLIQGDAPTTPASVKPKTTASENKPSNNGGTPAATIAAANNASNMQQQLAAANFSVAANAQLLKQQQQAQSEYLTALNKLEKLKVDREIAQDNQAIATAKLATATAEKQLTDLLVGPVPTASDYANKLENPGSTGQGGMTMQQQGGGYTIVSIVKQQHNGWHAVLTSGSKVYDVGVGDTLPLDGSTVLAIDKSSVTLKNADGSKKQRIKMLQSV